MEKVLVLNADYTPLNVTTLIKGFNLVYRGKAEVLEKSENPIITGYNTFVRPLIIRLLKYVGYRNKGTKISRVRLYKRDNYECAYCGQRKNLTIDHIIPKSRGGLNTWDNLVTCCSSCNRAKSNRTPEEANMPLRVKPYEPNIFSDIINEYPVENIWKKFRDNFGN
jgi:hypothetical protein